MNAHADIKPNTFEQARSPFADAGLRNLIPVWPGKKAPGRYLGNGRWTGLSGDHFKSGLGADLIETAAEWPTSGVGLRAAVFPAIDDDCHSAAASRLVSKAVGEVFGHEGYAVRVRDGSARKLYVFRAAREGAVTSRPALVQFQLAGDRADAKPHGAEVLASGHFVIDGPHPDGGYYGWHPDARLTDRLHDDGFLTLADADVDRFADVLVRLVEDAGGTIVGRHDGRGGSGSGERHDWSRSEPTTAVGTILDALDAFPNTPRNLPTHEAAVSFLARLYAALGREADDWEVMGRVEDWALAHADDHNCPPDHAWFERTWGSFRSGVAHAQHALSMFLGERGVRFSAAGDFPDDASDVMRECDRWIDAATAKKVRLLSGIARDFAFCDANTAEGEQFAQIRPRVAITKQRKAIDWWTGKTMFSHAGDLDDLQDIFGKGESGLATFLQAIEKAHPNCFFTATVRHPLHDIGAMVESVDQQGNAYFELNTRPLPPVQKLGAALPKGSGDPSTNKDVAMFLDFTGRVFGEHVDYELDCLADMAQTGNRPGNMLFLMGDGHTGKTMYADALSLMFDGEARAITGASLKSSFKFALLPLEGARIGQIIELPADMGLDTRGLLDSLVKVIVDASRKNATITLEAKGKDIREVPNYARLVVTSNFHNGMTIGEQDRRVFYVVNGINLVNTPGQSWWDKIDPIMKDEKRLAQVWRYLLDRDTRDYSRTAQPPTTAAKAEAQRAALTDPVQRHARDATSALKAAGRMLVDTKEMAKLMTSMAENEWENSGHRTDDRPGNDGYDLGKRGLLANTMARELGRLFAKLAEVRTGKERLGTVYVRKGSKWEKTLNAASNRDIIEAMEEDRRRHQILEAHMPAAVQGSVTPPAKGAADFDPPE